ncbi:MAG TPA: ABC transporter permease [Xanthobacteraceae bacterium]|nr:ABC transporter permease [Xanthobacteraceae bacterium]
MNLVGYAVRNLHRRSIRTSLSIFSIGLAVGSALALIAISRSIEDSTRQGMEESGDDVVVTQRGASDLFGGFVPQQTADEVAKIPGVARVSGELVMFAPSDRGRTVLAAGWPEGSYLWKGVPLREGRVPNTGERHVAIIGDNVAEALAKAVGDTIELHGDKFRIIGITKYNSVINRGTAIVPLTDLQDVTYRNRQVSLIHVNYSRKLSSADVARVKSAIESIGRVTVSTASEVLENDRNFAILKAVSLAVSIIALAMGALNVLNALLMATQERTHEIGIVAAIGWTDGQIMSSIVIEGMLMCAIGSLLGLLLSFFASFLFPMIPTIGSYLAFRPSVGLILPIVGSAFVLCAIGSLYPAWRAVRVPPALALRHV